MNLIHFLFGGLLLAVTAIVLIFDFKYGSLKDESAAVKKPYSFGRVQLSWWTVIIFSAFVACAIVTRLLPNLDPSLLILLGISGGTTLASGVIDAKSNQITSTTESNGFFADILNNGDMHRLQFLLFNVAVGVWFIFQVFHNLNLPLTPIFTVNMVLPAIPDYVLVLLGGSSLLYVGGKTQE